MKVSMPQVTIVRNTAHKGESERRVSTRILWVLEMLWLAVTKQNACLYNTSVNT